MTNPITKIVSFLDESKAEDIQSFDLGAYSNLADHFIIASGQSSRHLKALAEKLKHFLILEKFSKIRFEGMISSDWVIVDAGDVIIHLFHPDVRSLYNLEKIWQSQKFASTSQQISY